MCIFVSIIIVTHTKYVLNNVILDNYSTEFDKGQVYLGPHTKGVIANVTENCKSLQNIN